MAIVELQRRESHTVGYYHKEVIADGQVGNDIHIKPIGQGGAQITCVVHAGANTGKFQFTASPDADVAAGTAVWLDWPKGVITGAGYDAVTSPITGLRGVSVAGEIQIEITY